MTREKWEKDGTKEDEAKEDEAKEDGVKFKKRVVLVIDGDKAAGQAVRVAAKNIGARCISMSIENGRRG